MYSGANRVNRSRWELCQYACDNPGEHVTGATLRHSRIARAVDVDFAVRRSNDCAPSFQHQNELMLDCKIAGKRYAIAHDSLCRQTSQACHLAGMRSEDQRPLTAVE